ncbi:Chymotrypsin inhibitor 3 [Bienertia sinuspersici]
MATHFIASTFLLIIFVSYCSMIKAQVVINKIYDTNVDFVQTGKPYHILPVVRRRGGGVANAPTNANQACPLSIVQKSDTSALGEPVAFYNLQQREIYPKCHLLYRHKRRVCIRKQL